jgi:hypothetical protein
MGRYGAIALATLAFTAFAVGAAPAGALAAPQEDISSTHAVLVAAYKTLHTVIGTWPTVEANLSRLNRKFAAECPDVGAGSPQNESGQKLSYEVTGALWATGYHTDAKTLEAFTNEVSPLRWTDTAIVHRGLKFLIGLHEMIALQLPDLCQDVRTWIAGGYNTVPADTQQFDQHVEEIEVEIPSMQMFAPYVQPFDRGLFDQVKRLIKKFDELEFRVGQNFWNTLLGTLALNQ